MGAPLMSSEFATAFRTALVERVSPPPARRRHKWMLGGSIAILGLFVTTAAAAATGIFPLPGSVEVTPVSVAQVGSFTGTDSLDLGDQPSGATGIVVSLRCLTPGNFTFIGGAGLSCRDSDFLDDTIQHGFDSYLMPLAAAPGGRLTVTVAAPATARWSISAAYATSETSAWEVNAKGQTYGVGNENGRPDLVAVHATNGKLGYVLSADLDYATGVRPFTSREEALAWQASNAGVAHTLDVVEADGETVIGTFEIGG